MSDMRILVTGGAGFIGSSLCEKLVAMGNRVVALDSMFRGSEANLESILGSENFASELSIISGKTPSISQCHMSYLGYKIAGETTLKQSCVVDSSTINLQRFVLYLYFNFHEAFWLDLDEYF